MLIPLSTCLLIFITRGNYSCKIYHHYKISYIDNLKTYPFVLISLAYINFQNAVDILCMIVKNHTTRHKPTKHFYNLAFHAPEYICSKLKRDFIAICSFDAC